jgi:hypothetical protein
MVAGASTLLLDEYFAEANDRFFDELVASRADRKLHSLAPRWFADERPWARDMLLRYVDDGCDRHGHRGLVKALFKLAEEAGDDLLMAHFLVAFDRLIEHTVRKFSRFDWNTRESFDEYVKLRSTNQPLRQPRARRIKRGRFSIYTRQYMQRRALRYFRKIGFRDLPRYGKAARTALLLYEDRHLARSEQMLDAWGLMHFLYHASPVIVRDPRGVRVAEGRILSEVEPAPLHPSAWRNCFEELLAMLAAARSLVVRRWIVGWLEKNYDSELRAPDIRQIKRLLWSPHPDVQSFAAELLGRARGVETLPVVEWLALLDIDSPVAIPIICDLVARNVSPDRLDLAACIELACARPAPVAELGLRWARTKSVDDRNALSTALRLVEAKAANVLEEAIAWIAELVGRAALGTTQHVLDLLDARQPLARAAGIQLMREQKRFKDDLTLWAALAESPYRDVRAFLLEHLEARLSALPEQGVQRIWATTLLGVSGGSRTKRLVLRQLADRIVQQSDRAPEILPLLAIALRSVRETERRAALTAIAKAAFSQPALRAPLAEHIPELVLFPEVAP